MGSAVQAGKPSSPHSKTPWCDIRPSFHRGRPTKSVSSTVPSQSSSSYSRRVPRLEVDLHRLDTQSRLLPCSLIETRLRTHPVRWCMGLLRWECLRRWMNRSHRQCRCRIQAPRRPYGWERSVTGPDPLANAVADTLQAVRADIEGFIDPSVTVIVQPITGFAITPIFGWSHPCICGAWCHVLIGGPVQPTRRSCAGEGWASKGRCSIGARRRGHIGGNASWGEPVAYCLGRPRAL